MNNWEKSNLELTTAPDMTMLDENGTLCVLIKHDYYSSDTEHGRKILGAFLDTLAECGESISKIILIDSAVRILENEMMYSRLDKLFALSRCSYICEDSLAEFDIEYISHDNVILCSASDITMEIIQSEHLITLG